MIHTEFLPVPKSALRTDTSVPSRHTRRRTRNRARLVAAAREVMARKGLDGATIQEITDTADLALGTFYNYFDSKEAVLEAVVAAQADDFGDAMEEVIADMDDRALAISTCARLVIRHAASDPVWGWFVLRNEQAMVNLYEKLAYRAARDIRRGIEEGRFDVRDEDAALVGLCGIILSGVRFQLGEGPVRVSDAGLAACLLQMLGLTTEEATEIANRPLPSDLGASLTD